MCMGIAVNKAFLSLYIWREAATENNHLCGIKAFWKGSDSVDQKM